MKMDLIKNRLLKIETGVIFLIFLYIITLFLPLYSFVSVSSNDCKFIPIKKIFGIEKNGCLDNVMLFKIQESGQEKSYSLSWNLLIPLLLGIVFSAGAVFLKNGLIKRTSLVVSGACILFVPLAIFALSQLRLWVLFKPGIGWYILLSAGFLIGISKILFCKKRKIIFCSIRALVQLILGITLVASLALLALMLQVKDPFILLDYFGTGRGTEAIFTQDALFGVNLKGVIPETGPEEKIYSSINQADVLKIIKTREVLPIFRLDDRDVSVEEIRMAGTEIELLAKQEPKRIVEEEILSEDFDKYTQESETINFGAPIQNLAEHLENDPLNIFNYVKNNIEYESYFGIKRDAKGTLLTEKGNDYDQASLLIALLRVGNLKGEKKIPARYVKGMVLLSINQAMNLLGVNDPRVAAEIFELNNVPIKLIYNTSADYPAYIEAELVWVEAYMPYGYYKGLKGEGEKRWIPLVPFLKSSYYSQVEDIPEKIDFSGFGFWEEYVLNSQDFTPFDKYKNALVKYLENNFPDLTYEDILIHKYRQSEKFEFLPLGFPFKVVEEIGKYAVIDDRNYKLRFILEKDGNAYLATEISPMELLNKTLVLDYEPATVNDKDIINKAGGIYGVVPLTKVNVRPVIKSNGKIIRKGNPTTLGTELNFYLDFVEPKRNETTREIEFITIEETSKKSIMGVPESIAIFAGSTLSPSISVGVVHGSNIWEGYMPEEDLENMPNQMLYNLSLDYLNDIETKYKEIAQSLGGTVRFKAARAITSSQVNVEYKENQPYKFTWNGLQLNTTIFGDYYNRFYNKRKKNLEAVMLIGGLEADMRQAEIFKETFGVESLSTAKAFNLVNNGKIEGAKIVKITDSNIEELDKVKANINNEGLVEYFREKVKRGSILYITDAVATFQTLKGCLWYIILNGDFTVDYGSIFLQ